MTMTFQGPAGVQTFQAIALKHGLAMWRKHKMKPNRAWTISNMLRTAGAITGKTYTRSQGEAAERDLDAWLAVNGTSGKEA